MEYKNKISTEYSEAKNNLRKTFSEAAEFLEYLEGLTSEGFWISTAKNLNFYFKEVFLFHLTIVRPNQITFSSTHVGPRKEDILDNSVFFFDLLDDFLSKNGSGEKEDIRMDKDGRFKIEVTQLPESAKILKSIIDMIKAVIRNENNLAIKLTSPMFSWVETHKGITAYLSKKESNQHELIELLKSVGIGPFNDQRNKGTHNMELDEIDPFTFFCYIYKYGRKRLKYLRSIADRLDLKKPSDDKGIPSAQAQSVWLFPYKYERTNNEVDRLWQFFNKALNDGITDADFEDVLTIRGTGKAKLSEALFNILPDKYLPINGPTKPYLKEELGIDPKFNTFSEYVGILEEIKTKVDIPFYELSHEAWNWNQSKKKSTTSLSQFEKLKNKFDEKEFNNYIYCLRRINVELELEPNDARVVYSIKADRLNYIVGQRYCFNLLISDAQGVYRVISKEKLVVNSLPFDGNPPQPFYNRMEEFKPNSSEWKSITRAIKEELNRTEKSGHKKSNNSEFENYVFEFQSEKNTENMDFPLNTILYGPPGTGKTYNTVLRAAEIIENRAIDSYDEALEIFKANLHDRIEFITFHQNYSYEDFIQGLRPDIENNDGLTFERKDGVFKVIADKALKNLNDSQRPQIIKKPFEAVFNQFINPLTEGEVEEIEVKMKKVSFFITAIGSKSINFRKASGGSAHTLSIATLKKMYADESVLDIQGLASYYSPLLNKLLEIGKDARGRKEIVPKKNYVIIIDEINRANISRVFGELITLIEQDKRSHGAIPMEARLPSGDLFIVPSNLYIIGTMNTADKSIALLDIALRRRFVFESMYPKYDIPDKEIHDVDILEKINAQIIKSKGYDFQIGHSYFMGENNDLVQRMNTKVIPLLLEYYMNDKKEVEDLLKAAGLKLEEKAWPLKIEGRND